MKIVNIPHPALKKISEEVKTVDKKLIQFIQELEVTLQNKKDPPGVGLSAPQVAKNSRIFTTWFDHEDSSSITSYINPKIVSASKKLTLGGRSEKKPFLEGCLSIPDIYGPVWRHERVTLEFQVINKTSMELETRHKKFVGFKARVIQHEYDHLEGILFTERCLEQGLTLFVEEDGELVEVEIGS